MKQIFISYSRKDEEFKDDLVRHLYPLEAVGKVKIWQDGEINPGDEWEEEIKSHLESSDLVLLLISSYAITSDFIENVELKKAMEAHDRKEKKVIPIILRPCIWDFLPMAKIQALPKNAKPVDSWNNIHEAYTNIANGIARIL